MIACFWNEGVIADGTFFEQTKGLDRAEVIARVLKTRTDSSSYINLPVLSCERKQCRGGNVLDIGSGDGSFLFKIAEEHSPMHFLEQNTIPRFSRKHNPGWQKRNYRRWNFSKYAWIRIMRERMM